MHQVRSYAALVFGSCCIVATLITLFAGYGLNDLTINHLYITVSLIVTLGAGHFMWDAYADGRWGWLRGIAFTTLFVVGTVLCVALSGGRSGELMQRKDDAQAEVGARREAQQRRVDELQTSVEELKAAADRAKKLWDTRASESAAECASGKGRRCDGMRENEASARTMYDEAKEVYETRRTEWTTEASRLVSMPVAHHAHADLMQFARVYALITGANENVALERLKLLLPYAIALITEFGAIVFLKHAFAEARPVVVAPPPVRTVTIGDIARQVGMEPRVARKIVRELGISRPAEGWIWTDDEAERVRAQITAK